MKNRGVSRSQFGQSMVEYTIVLVFGVMVLTTGPGGDAMQQLLDVMKENYEGYSFAMSMSEAPDYDSAAEYRSALIAAGVSSEEADKLAVKSSDLYTDMTAYNKDPIKPVKDGINKVKSAISSLPTSTNSITGGSIKFP